MEELRRLELRKETFVLLPGWINRTNVSFLNSNRLSSLFYINSCSGKRMR